MARLLNCPCGRAATTTITQPIRIMSEHRTELRKVAVCPKCAGLSAEITATDTSEVATSISHPVDPYSWEATEQNFERHLSKLAEAIARWEQRDREDGHACYSAAADILLWTRSLSADTSWMAALEAKKENALR